MTSATATQVKKKTQKIGGRRINAQMIPTIAAVVIFILQDVRKRKAEAGMFAA